MDAASRNEERSAVRVRLGKVVQSDESHKTVSVNPEPGKGSEQVYSPLRLCRESRFMAGRKLELDVLFNETAALALGVDHTPKLADRVLAHEC